MKFRFGSKAKPKTRVIPVVWHEPKPPTILEQAVSIATKAPLTNAIHDMPDGSYALVITMTPTNEGTNCKAHVYPSGKDRFFYDGLYECALEFLYRRQQS